MRSGIFSDSCSLFIKPLSFFLFIKFHFSSVFFSLLFFCYFPHSFFSPIFCPSLFSYFHSAVFPYLFFSIPPSLECYLLPLSRIPSTDPSLRSGRLICGFCYGREFCAACSWSQLPPVSALASDGLVSSAQVFTDTVSLRG